MTALDVTAIAARMVRLHPDDDQLGRDVIMLLQRINDLERHVAHTNTALEILAASNAETLGRLQRTEEPDDKDHR
jgi:hypothetical protein